MEQAGIKLQARTKMADRRSVWSGDDTRFMIKAPFMLGAAILYPETKWNGSARVIDRIGSFGRNSRYTSSLAASVAEKLGVAPNRLQQIIATFRVNQTENLIHNMHNLWHKDWRPQLEIPFWLIP